MSALAIVLIVIGVLTLLLLLGGLAATSRREQRYGHEWERRVVEADQALEQARAADKGWDRRLLDDAARAAVEEARPGWRYEKLHLVLVDDRPGVREDRAHFVAAGPDGEARVVLARRDGGWATERVE
jgi:hypothetical protein